MVEFFAFRRWVLLHLTLNPEPFSAIWEMEGVDFGIFVCKNTGPVYGLEGFMA